MSGANPWLVRQRKSDLVELAQIVGLKEYVPLFHTVFPRLDEDCAFAMRLMFRRSVCVTPVMTRLLSPDSRGHRGALKAQFSLHRSATQRIGHSENTRRADTFLIATMA